MHIRNRSTRQIVLYSRIHTELEKGLSFMMCWTHRNAFNTFRSPMNFFLWVCTIITCLNEACSPMNSWPRTESIFMCYNTLRSRTKSLKYSRRIIMRHNTLRAPTVPFWSCDVLCVCDVSQTTTISCLLLYFSDALAVFLHIFWKHCSRTNGHATSDCLHSARNCFFRKSSTTLATIFAQRSRTIHDRFCPINTEHS